MAAKRKTKTVPRRAAVKREQVKIGRPTKLTAALQVELSGLLEAGWFLEHACAEVGIADVTVRDWVRQGDAVDGPKEMVAFSTAVTRARARAESNVWETIREKSGTTSRKLNPADWKADLERLKIMNPARYRETKRTELTGADGGAVQVSAPVIMIPPESDE